MSRCRCENKIEDTIVNIKKVACQHCNKIVVKSRATHCQHCGRLQVFEEKEVLRK